MLSVVSIYSFLWLTSKMLFNLLHNLLAIHFSQFITFHLEHLYLICIHLLCMCVVRGCFSWNRTEHQILSLFDFVSYDFNSTGSMTHAPQQTPCQISRTNSPTSQTKKKRIEKKTMWTEHTFALSYRLGLLMSLSCLKNALRYIYSFHGTFTVEVKVNSCIRCCKPEERA